MSGLPRIGVVGGGASAVCLLDALAQLPEMPPFALTVFDDATHLWRGRPYQPDFDMIRVNATPDDMSVRAADPEHLAEWLVARELFLGSANAFTDPISGAQFVPRATYGDYLEQSARAALMRLVSRGCEVSLVRQRVDAAEQVGHEFTLRTADGEHHDVDFMVLSVGAGKPADRYALTGSRGFVVEPYPLRHSLGQLDPDQDVTVIGSGLTAVDIVLALAGTGHRGRIRLCSRRGTLPGVRQRPVRYELRHFTAARFRAMAARGARTTLADLVSIMDDEVRSAGDSLAPIQREIDAIRHEDPVARLRRNLDEVHSPSVALRILQQAVPDAGPDVWPLLSEHEKDFVLTRHDRVLMSLCCPMPPASAATLLALIDSGQVELVRGLMSVTPDVGGGGFTVGSTEGQHHADTVVNAVNARLNHTNADAAPLVDSLVRAGVAEPHQRVGVHVERATSRLTVGARPQPRLYALGDPAAGSLFFTFGVQSLVDRAVDIAQHINEECTALVRSPARNRSGGDALLVT